MAEARLERYRALRDFARTTEPSGKGTGGRRRKAEGSFVVQKHAARRLHYDIRLAHAGVLLSWAVPRGPSLDPSEKRLAVRTEDHPLDYADFEGTIPRGEYGGGTVMLWDRGSYKPLADFEEGLKRGKLEFELAGERLHGRFALVRLRGRKAEKRENWLLIKQKDEVVDADWQAETFDTSVASSRDMDAIAQAAPAGGGRAVKRRSRTKTRSAPPPAFVAPQLATLVDAAPEGEDWLHEIKYDGYRLLAAVSGDRVRLYTRSGRDWTHRFGSIAEALKARDWPPVLLDGEVVVAGTGGRSDFGALQKALKQGSGDLVYYLFDLLRHDKADLRSRPLLERKEALQKLLGRRRDALRYSDHERGRGDRVARQACRLGLEGIISKRAQAPYRSARNRDWRKVKCVRRQELVIGGWSPSTRQRPFASLLLGAWEGPQLLYAGRVGTGFDEQTLERLGADLRKRERKTSPFEAVPAAIARSAHWCRPDLVAEVAYSEMTHDGNLRHGVFLGLREDKPARSVVMEARKPAENESKNEKPAGVTLTNPERVLFPAMGTTKRDLADYLVAVAPRLLPQLAGRPVSLVRCPQGRAKTCFFQKHAGEGFPEAFGSISIAEKNGAERAYVLVESEAALASCAQIGVLELHVWGSRKDAIEKPDRIVFDLDPDESVSFPAVRRAARDLADILEEAGLVSFPLITGGKGVHLVVPVVRRHSWDTTSTFAKAFAEKMAELDRKRFVATMSKAKRKDRIFIDHFRNRRGATAIAPYSPRAREGAPVALPVTWSELSSLKRANGFSFKEAIERVKSDDPWKGYADLRQSLTAQKLQRIGLEL
ncbi:DNA ligase D [Aquibaculum arenosum]|uniref:DNA ligase (ATP) n=1 Tax=Aquibaculum arenosum TaxID=3032591 RepID=A0ABT5YK49_9PROT|nr:DNA ligase D [Fodinicurvata sp. CAU 1616]MDF2095287.1 DNA ligase D [Fodinicurvata sp. CAU 1616]